MNHHPILYVVAGPNGAGKTTFAKRFLPEPDIRRRFSKSRHNLLQLYRPVFDSLYFFDNSGNVPRLVFEEWEGSTKVYDQKLYSSLFQEKTP